MIEFVLLIILLLAMVLFSYTVFKGDLLSPSFLCAAMYLFSCFIMLIYFNEWKVDFSILTGSVILFSIFCVFLGEAVAAETNKRIKKNDSMEEERNEPIIISQLSSIFCFVFSVITAILYFREIRRVVANSAYASSVYGQAYTFLRQYSWARILEGANIAYYVQQMYTCVYAIALVLLYIIIYNRVFYGKQKRNVFPLLTIIVYLITSFMTAGRAGMLNFFIYAIVVWIVLYYKKRGWKHRNNYKILFRALIIIAAALLLFYMAGFLTAKSLVYDNFFDNFANYFSSSIYCLNEFIKDPGYFAPSENFFGIHTLSGIYSFMRTLGFKIPKSIVALEYIKCGKYNTNIYTPLRRYLQDFSALGLGVIMFFIGFYYKKAVNSLRRHRNFDLKCILVAMFFFPLFFISIEERLFMDVILMRSVYEIIYVVIIYQWIINKKFIKWKVRIK